MVDDPAKFEKLTRIEATVMLGTGFIGIAGAIAIHLDKYHDYWQLSDNIGGVQHDINTLEHSKSILGQNDPANNALSRAIDQRTQEVKTLTEQRSHVSHPNNFEGDLLGGFEVAGIALLATMAVSGLRYYFHRRRQNHPKPPKSHVKPEPYTLPSPYAQIS